MWKFKKEFANNTIAFRGRLISSRNISDKLVEQIIKEAPSLAVNFEKVEAEETLKIQKVEAEETLKIQKVEAKKAKTKNV